MKRRLLSIFCALCLCLTLLPTAALADGLEPGTPTLLDGEDETGYATPSTDDGWSLLTSSTWYTDQKKTYEQHDQYKNGSSGNRFHTFPSCIYCHNQYSNND